MIILAWLLAALLVALGGARAIYLWESELDADRNHIRDPKTTEVTNSKGDK